MVDARNMTLQCAYMTMPRAQPRRSQPCGCFWSERRPDLTSESSLAMGAPQNVEQIKSTLEFSRDKSRDQDIFYFFAGLGGNDKARRLLTAYFEENFAIVSVCCVTFSSWLTSAV